MKKLHARLADFGEPEVVDKIDDLVQRGFDNDTAAPHRAKPKYRALPEILITAFSHRHVEVMTHPRLDSLEDSALAFERVILGNQEIELEDAHNHAARKKPRIPSVECYAPTREGSRPVGVGLMRRMTGIRS